MRLALWQQLNRLATYDFLPHFSAHVRRWLYNPFGVLLVAVALALLCGVALHPQGFVLGGGLLLVIVLGICWPWLTLRGLHAVLTFETAQATEGEPVPLCLTVNNRWWWPAFGITVQGGFGQTLPLVALARLRGRRGVECRWSFTPTMRGCYPQGPVLLATGFPFGLWETSRLLPVANTLVVWPRTYPVGPVPPVSGAKQVEGHVARNQVGTSGDMMGVRPYRRGDSPRRIHWAQSARHDRLIVCELQTTTRPVLLLVLDTDRHVHLGSGPNASLEWAIRITASFAVGWLKQGAEVGLVCGTTELRAAAGAAQAKRILDALAVVTRDGPPLATMLSCPQCRGFRDGLQIVITTDHAAHHGCGSCIAADQRWVVLASTAFGHDHAPTCIHGQHPPVWLRVNDIEQIPSLLHGGWSEAQHGS